MSTLSYARRTPARNRRVAFDTGRPRHEPGGPQGVTGTLIGTDAGTPVSGKGLSVSTPKSLHHRSIPGFPLGTPLTPTGES